MTVTEVEVPCPSWCSGRHDADTACIGAESNVDLILDQPSGHDPCGADASVYLYRRPGGPVTVCVNVNDQPVLEMTSQEAAGFMRGLMAALNSYCDGLDAAVPN